GLAVVVAEHLAAGAEPAEGAVGALDAVLGEVGAAFAGGPLDGLVDAGAVLGEDVGGQEVGAGGGGIDGVEAEDAVEAGVVAFVIGAEVPAPGAHLGGGEGEVEAFLAAAEGLL